jgi:hypothetical protein
MPSSYHANCKIEGHSPGWNEQKRRPYLQNNHYKKGWRCGIRGRASQEESPEFKTLLLLKVNDKIKKGGFYLLLF